MFVERRAPRLAPDSLRSICAAIIALLCLGGWVYVLLSDKTRMSIGERSATWWVEQLVLLLQAIFCLGVVLRLRNALSGALALTALALLAGLAHWVQALAGGRTSLPVVLALNVVLFWRLLASRQMPIGAVDAPAA